MAVALVAKQWCEQSVLYILSFGLNVWHIPVFKTVLTQNLIFVNNCLITSGNKIVICSCFDETQGNPVVLRQSKKYAVFDFGFGTVRIERVILRIFL